MAEFDPAAAFLAAMADPEPQPTLADDLAVPTPEFDPEALSQEAFLEAMRGPEPAEEILTDEPDQEAALIAQGGELEPDIAAAELPDPTLLGQPPAELAPDAISGAEGPAFPVDVVSGADFAVDPAAVAGMEAEQEPMTDAERFAAMTPEELAMEQFRQAQERQQISDDAIAEADAAAIIRQSEHAAERERAIADAQEQTASMLERSKLLAAEEIDQGRWWSSRSTGQKIANYVAVLLGGQLGIISGRGGNDALDLINNAISQDIEVQVKNLQRRRGLLSDEQGLVAQELQLSGDMYQARKTAELAIRAGVEQKISEQLAQLDPSGVQAMQLETYRRKVRGSMAASAQEAADETRTRALENLENDRKEREQFRKEAETAAKIAKAKAETAKLKRRGTGGGKPKMPSPSVLLSASKAGYSWDPATGGWVGGATVGGGGVETKEQAQTRKAIADANLAEKDMSDKELDETLGIEGLNTADNRTVRFIDPADRKIMAKRKAFVDEATRLYDNIAIARAEHGFKSSFVDSDSYRKVKADHSKLVTMLKGPEGADLGVIAGPDEELLHNLISTGDPGEYRDFNKALQHSRKLWVDGFNDQLRSAARKGYKPARYEPAHRRPAKADKITAKESLKTAGQGLLPHVRKMKPGAPERKKSVANQRAKMEALVVNEKDPFGHRTVARDLQKQVEAGSMTRQEAVEIASPLAANVARVEALRIGKRHKKEIQAFSTKEALHGALPWQVEMRRLEGIANKATQHPLFRGEAYDYLLNSDPYEEPK